MAVNFVTEFSNGITLGNLVAATSSPALVKGTVMMNHMYAENLPERTMTKKFPKNGSLTAASLAESTALAINANGELLDTSADLTAAKVAVSSGLSIEDQKFGTISTERVGAEQFSAIARAVDVDALSLFSGLATSVTSASVMTIDDIMQGIMSINNSNCPDLEVTPTYVGTPKSVYNIQKEIIQGGNASYSNDAMLDIFRGATMKANGFKGKLANLCDIYQTTGLATSGSDDVNAVFHPKWTFCGMFDSQPLTWLQNKGADGWYTEIASCYFYDVGEWNDLCGVKLLSDT